MVRGTQEGLEGRHRVSLESQQDRGRQKTAVASELFRDCPEAPRPEVT